MHIHSERIADHDVCNCVAVKKFTLRRGLA